MYSGSRFITLSSLPAASKSAPHNATLDARGILRFGGAILTFGGKKILILWSTSPHKKIFPSS
jgi:hypothetical protein